MVAACCSVLPDFPTRPHHRCCIHTQRRARRGGRACGGESSETYDLSSQEKSSEMLEPSRLCNQSVAGASKSALPRLSENGGPSFWADSKTSCAQPAR